MARHQHMIMRKSMSIMGSPETIRYCPMNLGSPLLPGNSIRRHRELTELTANPNNPTHVIRWPTLNLPGKDEDISPLWQNVMMAIKEMTATTHQDPIE